MVFLVTLTVYCLSPVTNPTDSRWFVPTALAMIRAGNADLSGYPRVADDYRLSIGGGQVRTAFPLGTVVVALPFVYAIDRAADNVLGLDLVALLQDIEQGGPTNSGIERFIASLLVATTTLLVYRLACRLLPGLSWQPLLVAGVFAFATPAWSTASRALWQHGPSMLMLTAALSLLVAAEERPWLASAAGVPLALSYFIRPTNAVSLLLLTGYVLGWRRRQAVGYLLAAGITAAVMLAVNVKYAGAAFPSYFAPGRLALHSRFLEALAGNLVSPARGLLVYSPVFVFAAWGLVLKRRGARWQALDGFIAAAVPLHWLAVSAYPQWWAGFSLGPRFMSDMTPYLVYFLIPAVGYLLGTGKGMGRAVALGFFLALMLYSAWVHYGLATVFTASEWNVWPQSVDVQPGRLWDWGDMPIFR